MNPRHQRSPKNLTLNDVFPGWYDHQVPQLTSHSRTFGGVFTMLNEAQHTIPGDPFPWLDGMTAEQKFSFMWSLDLVYHGVKSGNKFITDLLYRGLIDPIYGSGDIPYFNAPGPLYMAVASSYMQKWSHLWSDYTLVYNATHTYDILESESATESETTTPNLTDTTTVADSINDSENETRTPNITEGLQIAGSDTKTPNITENETVTETRNTTDETTYGKQTTDQGESTENASLSVYGFNSSEAVPKDASTDHIVNGQTSIDSGKDTTTGTGSITTGRQFARAGSEGDSYTEASTRQTTGTEQKNRSAVRQRAGGNTVHKTGTATVSGTRAITRSRSGNMFKSPAELLRQDREFWMTHYFEFIFDDLDKLLTLPIFSEKDVKFKVF